jgi:hypothetical protein
MLNIAIALVVLGYVIGLVFLKPVSGAGRFTLMVSLINALVWVVILFLPAEGHPPAWLFVVIGFWPLSVILVPATGVVLWKSYKAGDEKKSYFVMASLYLFVNLVVFVVVPIVLLFRNP